MSGMRHAIPSLLVLAVLVLAWQALHSLASTSAITSPAETLARLATLTGTERFWLDVGETGVAFLWALLLSILLGVVAGIMLGLSKPVGKLVEPILVIFYSLPKVTLYPLVLLGFGLGLSAKVAFGVMHGFVPITLLTRNAILQIRPVHRKTARVLHLSRMDTLRSVILPAIAPDLVAGIRIGFSLSLLGVLTGEMFASKRGLGFSAVNAMNLGDIGTIMAIGVFLAAFAVLANSLLLAAERRIRFRTAR
ncbi:ABC transporter permease [Roseomonas gilardii]|uniref:ABC transporter permease n=1 Tax=Roseomonas gilardii TaxID=257708 RepID=UPI0021B55DB4|nr:ABC transporter permease subunit [Roseomonas gilardii]